MAMLNTPIRVGKIDLPNRLVLPPMATAKSGPNGTVSDSLCAYYREKTDGGAIGLLITEHSYIRPDGMAGRGQLSICRDEDIPGLRRLTDTVHRNHTKVFAQISHAGSAAAEELTGCPAISASRVRHPRAKDALPREMTLQDIAQVTDCFARAAARAKAAGFDGVELHSAHGYLLNQFYSPLTNQRTDAYTGATLEGRTRLHVEVIRAVRSAVGADYPIALRLGACDYVQNGTTLADSVRAASVLEEAGVDLLDVSGGFCFYTNPFDKTEGYFRELTAAIRKAVSVPVLLTGGIVTPEAAEALLAHQCADLIGVGRAILRDSDWARRALSAQ